jgi:diacylglycerol kinase family enzyme
MAGIGIITNPHSRLNKSNPNNIKVLGYILGTQGRLEVTNTLDDLSRVALQFKEQGITILAINGGDGTVSRTLTAFIKTYGSQPLPKIALLRGGTMNVIALNLGLRGSPDQLLATLVEAYSAGVALSTTPLSTLQIGDSYGFLFGTGVAYDFLLEYYQRKSGPLGAFFWCLAVWFSGWFQGQLYKKVMKEKTLNIVSNGADQMRQKTVCLLSSTVRKMPLGYPLFYKLKEVRRKIQCVSFTITPKEAIWKFPLIMIKGRHASKGDKYDLLTDQLRLSSDEPIGYTLDGELYRGQESLELKLGPEVEFVSI